MKNIFHTTETDFYLITRRPAAIQCQQNAFRPHPNCFLNIFISYTCFTNDLLVYDLRSYNRRRVVVIVRRVDVKNRETITIMTRSRCDVKETSSRIDHEGVKIANCPQCDFDLHCIEETCVHCRPTPGGTEIYRPRIF